MVIIILEPITVCQFFFFCPFIHSASIPFVLRFIHDKNEFINLSADSIIRLLDPGNWAYIINCLGKTTRYTTMHCVYVSFNGLVKVLSF